MLPASMTAPPDPPRLMMADLPEEDRPRERLHRLGADSLTTDELLAILLGSGSRNESALDLAGRLLKRFDNDLVKLANASSAQLCEIRGIGPAKSAHLLAIFSLASKLAQTKMKGQAISSSDDAADYMRHELLGRPKEELHMLMLNKRGIPVGSQRVNSGGLDRVQAEPRDIFRVAIQANAHRIILFHNHPGGDPSPSRADIDTTRRIIEAGALIGIGIADHIIFGRSTEHRHRDYFSLHDAGLMPNPGNE
jgi:DNA repair protein RadC